LLRNPEGAGLLVVESQYCGLGVIVCHREVLNEFGHRGFYAS